MGNPYGSQLGTSSITSTPANVTNVLGTLEGIVNYGDNYGERIQGYFTAPATGNYFFWIAGSDSAHGIPSLRNTDKARKRGISGLAQPPELGRLLGAS